MRVCVKMLKKDVVINGTPADILNDCNILLFPYITIKVFRVGECLNSSGILYCLILISSFRCNLTAKCRGIKKCLYRFLKPLQIDKIPYRVVRNVLRRAVVYRGEIHVPMAFKIEIFFETVGHCVTIFLTECFFTRSVVHPKRSNYYDKKNFISKFENVGNTSYCATTPFRYVYVGR